MHKRIIKYLTKYDILYKFQFGFRENHGTNIALSILVDKISQNLQDGKYVLGVFLDFRKAFDTVNHEILLNKLNKYGLRGNVLKWFISYLTNRKQYVSFDSHVSSKLTIECGVPQGSILRPI